MHLTRNYRSGGHVVDAARAVVAAIERRVDKRLWTAAPRGERVLVAKVDGGPAAEARREHAERRREEHRPDADRRVALDDDGEAPPPPPPPPAAPSAPKDDERYTA